MKLFPRKQTPEASAKPQSARRRPSAAEQDAKRTPAFSYYARRSNSSGGTSGGSSQSDSGGSGKATSHGSKPQSASDSGSDGRNFAPAPPNRWAMTISGLVLVVVVMSMLSLGSHPKIVIKTANGGNYFMQDINLYEQSATRSLEGSLLNRNKLTVDVTKVTKDLTDNFPEIAKATIELPLVGRRPVVHIEPHRPTFILTTTSSTAFLLDEQGRALVSTSQIQDKGGLSVPTIQDKSGLPVTPGSRALPASTIAFTEAVLRVLEATRVEYSSLILPPASSELNIAIKGKPYYVKFNIQGDARQQAGTYVATKERLEKDRVVPSQYIDVRVPERAYYK